MKNAIIKLLEVINKKLVLEKCSITLSKVKTFSFLLFFTYTTYPFDFRKTATAQKQCEPHILCQKIFSHINT